MDLITSIVLVLCRLNFVMIAVARTIGQSSIQEVDELYLPPPPSLLLHFPYFIPLLSPHYRSRPLKYS